MSQLPATQYEQVELGLNPRPQLRPLCFDSAYTTAQRPKVLFGTTSWTLVAIALFSLLTTVVAMEKQNNIITKRFSANPLCPQTSDRYCEPKDNANFTSADTIRFAWNTLDNTYSRVGQLDIYLFRYANDTPLIYKPSYPNDGGVLWVKPELTWFDPYNPQGNNTNKYYFIAKEPGGDPPMFADHSPFFNIKLLPPPTQTESSLGVTTVTTSVITTQATPLTQPIYQKESKAQLSTGVITAIALSAAALLILLLVMVIFLYRSRNKGKHNKHRSNSNLSTSSNAPMVSISTFPIKDLKEKGEPDSPIEASSIHSRTPLATKESMSSLSQQLALHAGIGLTTTTTASSPLKSTSDNSAPSFDAAMISDAYRKVLRKPDWKEEDDDFDTEVGLSEEELWRRREAKEIMKKELAEEGTGLHSVQARHTKVEVNKIVENDEQDPK